MRPAMGVSPTTIGSFTPERIAEFWSQHPCGAHLVHEREWREFFLAYDRFKYALEPHILEELDRLDVAAKRVLEIGLGQGAEAQQLVQRRARYCGIDLTEESVRRVRLRCELFELPYETLAVMNADRLAFPDSSFDLVFSHGVLHHSPRIHQAVAEVHRVLRPGGTAVVMLYHRHSVNYHVSIRILRRAGIFLLFVPGASVAIARLMREPLPRLEKHRTALRREGLGYLRMQRFIHAATDGPDNVYSAVFGACEARQLFGRFENVELRAHFLNERHLPLVRRLLPRRMRRWLARKWGWHLWVTGRRAMQGPTHGERAGRGCGGRNA